MRANKQWVDWRSDKAKINDQVKTFKMNSGKMGSVVSRKRTRGESGGEGVDGSSSSGSSSNSSGGGGKAKKRKKAKKAYIKVNKIEQIEMIKVVETEGNIGKYSPEARKERLCRFMAKRLKRIWTKRIMHHSRTTVANYKLRYKGRFLKKDDEELLRAAMEIC